jgi:hypothetical protein
MIDKESREDSYATYSTGEHSAQYGLCWEVLRLKRGDSAGLDWESTNGLE